MRKFDMRSFFKAIFKIKIDNVHIFWIISF